MPEELTPEDVRNGWTAEALTLYQEERMKASMAVVGFEPGYRERPKPMACNSKYSKFKWRG